MRPPDVGSVDGTLEGPLGGRGIAGVEIQEVIRTVLALHADVDVGVSGEVVARTAFAPG